MFDALQDTPSDFQFKLMDALNSLGQTMEIPPTECFDKVLCASDDENPDVKKTMYNWWRAFFEVLGKCDKMPKDRETEFKQKVDALMAEIMKSGDKEASGGNEVVLEDFEQVKEDYEEADNAEEDEMNKDFDFAVQHIGEIANKVKDVVNFINPYCESIGGTSKMNEDEVREFVKSIGFRPDSDGIDYETQLVDALTGKDTSYNAGWGAVYYNSDKVLQYLKKFGMLGSRGIKQKEAISKLRRLFKSGKWKTQQDEQFNEVNDTMKKTNERGGFGLEPDWEDLPDDWGSWNNYDGDEDDEGYDMDSDDYEMSDDEKRDAWRSRHKYLEKGNAGDWVSMNDIVGMEVGESDWGGKSTTRTLNFTKWEVDGLMDYIAEEIAHLEGEASGLNIMGIVPKRILEYIELKGFASSVKKLDPKEVIIKWADGSGIEDEFAPAKGNSKSVYDLVKDIYKGNSEYSESKVALEDSIKMTPEQRKVVDNAKKTAKKDGYDQYIILDKEDGSWSFARKHTQDKSEFDKFNQEVVGIVTSDDLQYKPYSLDESDEQKPDEVNDVHNGFKVGDKITWRHHNGSLSNEVVRELADGGYIVDDGFAGAGECYPGHVPDELLDKPNMEWDGKEWKQGIGMAEGTEDKTPDEVKGGEKKFKKDGETKTLVTGSDKDINNKQEVTEMTIEQEVTDPWKLLELLWGQGRENLRELLESELFDDEFVMQMIEDMEIHDLTSLNDAFAFDFETILDMFGCDPHAWSQNLEIKMKGDDDSEEEEEED